LHNAYQSLFSVTISKPPLTANGTDRFIGQSAIGLMPIRDDNRQDQVVTIGGKGAANQSTTGGIVQ
jgi:hypothetical protein